MTAGPTKTMSAVKRIITRGSDDHGPMARPRDLGIQATRVGARTSWAVLEQVDGSILATITVKGINDLLLHQI